MKSEITVFCDMALYNLADGHKCVQRTCCLHLHYSRLLPRERKQHVPPKPGISQATSCHIQKDHHKNIHRRANIASCSITLVQVTELQFRLQSRTDISIAFSVPNEFSASDTKCTIVLRDSQVKYTKWLQDIILQFSLWKSTCLFKINCR
jgi:hypothetical protein